MVVINFGEADSISGGIDLISRWVRWGSEAQEVYGSEHVYVAGALNTLGGAYAAQKNLASALPIYRRALAIQQEEHGEMHPKTLQARYNLAAVLKYGAGLQREALELIMPVLHMHEESCTPGDMQSTLGEP
jgi:tetratricopeptide (TPR) repeat protein